ncbi:uncharacterized protein LOC143034107 [Oratosquilla oratoria]|uniref:uncharacterized protein LOC143034107 n=1 Tax=Oratosquilla oratoria TaxID=337810 RepID=UPI003F777E99
MSLPPSIQDFNRALKRKKPGKAPGPDNIPLELLSDFRNANIITISKIGDRENCNNYRGVTLLSIASKIFTCILLDHLLILKEGQIAAYQKSNFWQANEMKKPIWFRYF